MFATVKQYPLVVYFTIYIYCVEENGTKEMQILCRRKSTFRETSENLELTPRGNTSFTHLVLVHQSMNHAGGTSLLSLNSLDIAVDHDALMNDILYHNICNNIISGTISNKLLFLISILIFNW